MLIGSDVWAAELTPAELSLFQQGLALLQRQWLECSAWLMPEETLELEHDCGPLWLQLRGTASSHWTLRFVLSPAAGSVQQGFRGLEGSWDAATSGALAAALEDLVLPMDINVPA